MNRIRPHSSGLAFAGFIGLWHTLWAFLVWMGAAQWLINFIFRLHMLTPPYKVNTFSFGMAAALVLVTTLTGYVSGYVIGAIWNRCVSGTSVT